MAEKKRRAKRSPKQITIEEIGASALDRAMPFILGGIGAFMLLCIILGETDTGIMGKWLFNFCKGLFSVGAYPLPILLILHAVFYKRDLEAGSQAYKFIFTFFLTTFIGVLCALVRGAEPIIKISENYVLGKDFSSGGVFGGMMHFALIKLVGEVATWVITILGIVIFLSLVIGKSPSWLLKKIFTPIVDSAKESIEERKIIKAEKDKLKAEAKEDKDAERLELARKRAQEKYSLKDKKKDESDFCEYSEESEEDPEFHSLDEEKEPISFEEPEPEIISNKEKKDSFIPIGEIPPEPLPPLKNELPGIFGEDLEMGEEIDGEFDENKESGEVKDSKIEAKKEEVGQAEEIDDEEEYVFPPISFLPAGKPVAQADMKEQEQTAKKLVETLSSFGVKTSIIGVSKGPTITRYELQPQPGVRVRSITNLADDIALALASSGVRIEAPIPGKEAVGIEVPNKDVDTVYLRTLIESDQFKTHKSKLYGCLGMDVAGKPVYCDIAKMPHMLVAGATGMGKSVCMNSLIMSILYHATPDEVKMILIDPKKVEMGVYNKLPHLIVPVVTDAKKAAGALNWAVIEMEKRFIEMEEVGVRDIKMYNEVTKNDPEKRRIPQIVIFIDELADLMMMARDEVETSICRIAQKARAAGMHLVIGTQRPSVDVVTGLIKANIPSRIALTVASQVDSRTIIDIQGAEKLIGRGDMLYAPVGAVKPMRVQGCYVDEKDIEAVCDYIREERCADYDEKVLNEIEREAAKCGEKKKNAIYTIGGDEEADGGGLFADKDALLEKAIEIAITENKVSTSLLQRKLSVGYARAAKLVDFMAEMGVVGEYAGSKPREVLWTREFFDEYKMKAQD